MVGLIDLLAPDLNSESGSRQIEALGVGGFEKRMAAERIERESRFVFGVGSSGSNGEEEDEDRYGCQGWGNAIDNDKIV